MHFRCIIASKRKACLYWLTFLKDISKVFTYIFFFHSFSSQSYSSFLSYPALLPHHLSPESCHVEVQSTTYLSSYNALYNLQHRIPIYYK